MEKLGSIKRVMNMIKSATAGGNVSASQIINQVASQDPMMASVVKMINGSGMSAKDMFYMLAQQKGIDPNALLSMLNT